MRCVEHTKRRKHGITRIQFNLGDIRSSGASHLSLSLVSLSLIMRGRGEGRLFSMPCIDDALHGLGSLKIGVAALDDPKGQGHDQHDSEDGNGPVHVGDAGVGLAGEEEEDGGDGAVGDGDAVDDGTEAAELELAWGELVAADNHEGRDGHGVGNGEGDGADAENGVEDGVGKGIENADETDDGALEPQGAGWDLPSLVDGHEVLVPGDTAITSETPGQTGAGGEDTRGLSHTVEDEEGKEYGATCKSDGFGAEIHEGKTSGGVQHALEVLDREETDDHEEEARDSSDGNRHPDDSGDVLARLGNLLHHVDCAVESSQTVGSLQETEEPGDAVVPTSLVDPLSKDKGGGLESKVVLGTDGDEERQSKDEEERGEADTDKVVEPGQDPVLSTRDQVDDGAEESDGEVEKEVDPAGARLLPIWREKHLHAKDKVGHEGKLRCRQSPPPKGIDPGAKVRGEAAVGCRPESRDPVGLAQRRGHAAGELTERDGDTEVTDGDEDQAPENGDGATSSET